MKTMYLIGCVKRDISRWINRHSSGNAVDLSTWYCGITHHTDTSRLDVLMKEKGNHELHFKCWLANDLIASQEILSFFIKNGMVNKPIKGKLNSQTKFVYVFKIHPQLLDDVINLLS